MREVMSALLGDNVIAFAGYLRNASLFVAQYCTAATAVPQMLTRVAIVFSLTSFLSTDNCIKLNPGNSIEYGIVDIGHS
jgi:hypothetical protein